MKAIREELLDRVIAACGYENPLTIAFANACEQLPQTEADDAILATYAEEYQRIAIAEDKWEDE